MDRNLRQLSAISGSFDWCDLSSIIHLCEYDHNGLCCHRFPVGLCGRSSFPSLALGVAHVSDDPILDKFFSADVCVDLNFTGGWFSEFYFASLGNPIGTSFVIVY